MGHDGEASGATTKRDRTVWACSAVIGLLALIGCATFGETEATLLPAPGHAISAGSSLTVQGRGGLLVIADGDTWQGSPENLSTLATPVWVTLKNLSHDSLQIRYGEFGLDGQSGTEYRVLTPYTTQTDALRHKATGPNPAYFDGFYVADYLAPIYPGLPVWQAPLDYRRSHHPVDWGQNMPTASMIGQALPEGVLGPGGRASGFLYFQKLSPQEKAVSLRAHIQTVPQEHQPSTQVAAIDIPFRVIR